MDQHLAVYQLHVMSADKIDERRDITIRSYGGMSVIVVGAIAGTFGSFPIVSAYLSVLMIAISWSWHSTLKSLTAKLTAKHSLLEDMENDGKVPVKFLICERKHWESKRVQSLQKSLNLIPIIFCIVSILGLIANVVYLIYPVLNNQC